MIADGREAPDAFYEKPDLDLVEQFYWESFFDLSTERQIGMGAGPIPRSAIRAYAAECDIFGDHLEIFQRIIRLMDSEYLTLNSPTKDTQLANSVSADDAEGVRAVFSRVEGRAKNAKRKPNKVIN